MGLEAFTIYTLNDPRREGIAAVHYVGITRHSLLNRLAGHLHDAARDDPRAVCAWIRQLRFEGVEPIITVVELTDDKSRERFWIAAYLEQGAPLANGTWTSGRATGSPSHDRRSNDAGRPSARRSAWRAEFRFAGKCWVITSSADEDLPRDADRDLYVALIAITPPESASAEVPFDRRGLLRRLGWEIKEESYARLGGGLLRLMGTGLEIRTGKAVHSFSLLGEYCRPHREHPHRWFFRWNSAFWEHRYAPIAEGLNLHAYLARRSPWAEKDI